ncbi:MAG: DM13 domain-containing protein [Planctomycetota bacterium]
MKHLQHLVLSLTVLLLVACSGAQVDDPAAAAVNPAAVEGGTTLFQGTFDGRNDHVVTGGVDVVEVDGGLVLRLADDFSLDGAPDPKIGFGKGGTYDTSTTFTPLRSNTGSQSYALPAGLDVSAYDEAYIWCEQFSVALGVAALR